MIGKVCSICGGEMPDGRRKTREVRGGVCGACASEAVGPLVLRALIEDVVQRVAALEERMKNTAPVERSVKHGGEVWFAPKKRKA